MSDNKIQWIREIRSKKDITKEQLQWFLSTEDEDVISALRMEGAKTAKSVYGNKIFIRGLIELTNYCKNDCFYCGIRRSNKKADRYRLSKDQVLKCCDTGYELGFRTFVLQGGEDPYFSDQRICELVSGIKSKYNDCAITLSLGEKRKESYRSFFNAGADRYLLRHETADRCHYEYLHPKEMSYDSRIECLWNLKEIGYQVGCGFMVGSPNQTLDSLWKDIQFIRTLQPQMVGIGPFIPQQDTPFSKENPGTMEMTLRLLSIVRLIHPNVLLPATTALGTINSEGREKGILAGANVVMPNLSPLDVREKYKLYDNKIYTNCEAAECLADLANRMKSIGYEVVVDRGDYKG